MFIRTNIIFGDFAQEIAKLKLEGAGLLCCRRCFDPAPLKGLDLCILRISPEPTVESVRAYWHEIEDKRFDYVLAIGGGSIIDVAKILAARMENEEEIENFIGVEKIRHKAKKLIAVPTTHGSGSEVTKYSVLKLKDVKKSVASENIYPDVAIIDEKLTFGLPKDLTIHTSIDALCHNIEAYLTKFCDPLTDIICESGVKVFFEGIEEAISDVADGRKRMMLSSVLGGIAITNAQTSVVHALSHVLGGMCDVPHGLANAVFLPAFLKFYAEDEKFRRLEKSTGIDIRESIRDLYEKYGVKGLSDFVDRGEALKIAERAFENKRLLGGGRKPVTLDDLKEIVLDSF
ncbi:MAG: iron-containing alcohol dehydrogenase [Hadesarchaea archaeon]|nr:iron-containing alcohol dehydrogenase [Hadesarchaea archaeon]